MSDLISREDAIAVLCFCEETKMMLCKDLRKILEKINAIPSAEPERRWIPVTEALPEEEVTVLVSAHYDGDKCYGYKANDYVTTAEYMDGRWFLSDEEYIMHLHKHHVFAWMPLPEVYRGEG